MPGHSGRMPFVTLNRSPDWSSIGGAISSPKSMPNDSFANALVSRGTEAARHGVTRKIPDITPGKVARHGSNTQRQPSRDRYSRQRDPTIAVVIGEHGKRESASVIHTYRQRQARQLAAPE